MKKPLIISALILPAVFVIFSSNSSGPAAAGNGIRNGGPASNGTCGGCHGGGSGTTTINISLVEKATGTAANGIYKPGVVYTVTLSGTNPNLPFFGFQLSAATAAHQQAGAFSNLGGNKHVSNQSGFQIVEHSTNIAKTNGNYEATFDWTAPAAGKGTVTFYGIINAVNDDNNTTGDKVSAPSTLNLTEQGATGIDQPELSRSVQLYPNPANDMLYVHAAQFISSKYDVQILDVRGKVVLRDYQSADPSSSTVSISLKSLKSGIYFIRMEGNKQKIVRMFTKQ